MATNEVFPYGKRLTVTVGSSVSSGDPVVFGQRPGVALTSSDTSNNASVSFEGVYNLSVKGIDGSGNSAVAAGDILYLTSGDTPKISKKATGVRYGYALGTVTSGSTATISVILGY